VTFTSLGAWPWVITETVIVSPLFTPAFSAGLPEIVFCNDISRHQMLFLRLFLEGRHFTATCHLALSWFLKISRPGPLTIAGPPD